LTIGRLPFERGKKYDSAPEEDGSLRRIDQVSRVLEEVELRAFDSLLLLEPSTL